MITFSMSLSMAQIAILQAIKNTQDGAREYFKTHKTSGDDNPQGRVTLQFRNWVSWIRNPMKEGLLTWNKVHETYNFGYWELTRKGELVLELVQMDVRESLEQLRNIEAIEEKPVKRIGSKR